MSHALSLLLTATEREQARQIWDLLERDERQSFEAYKAAPERVRAAIFEVAQSRRSSLEPEPNPFV